MRKFYSAGYRRLKFKDFVRAVLDQNIIVADCRHQPFTSNEWNYHCLAEELGKNFIHVPALGNKRFREGVLSVNDLTAGIKILEELSKPFLILCACPKIEKCHRSIIVKELENRGWVQEDFDISPAERITTEAQKQLSLF